MGLSELMRMSIIFVTFCLNKKERKKERNQGQCLPLREWCLEKKHERNVCVPGNFSFLDLDVKYTVHFMNLQ